MTYLVPLRGSPESVRLVADRLLDSGRSLAAMSGVLATMRDGAVWDGPAGSAFGARLGAAPGVLDAAARRLVAAVVPLRALAAALEDAQHVAERAGREYADAEDEYVRLEHEAWRLVSSGTSESDPLLLALRERQRELAGTMERARARHTAAFAEFHEADRHCTRILRALADDGIADPWGYRGLQAASEAGHGVGQAGLLGPVVPQSRGIGLVGEAVGTAADTALLVGYGQGSWSQMGTSAGLYAVGFAGGSLAKGAGVGARMGSEGVEVLSRVSARERLVAGAALEARRRISAVRRGLDAPPRRATPSAMLGGPPVPPPPPASLADRVRRAAEAARARARAAADAAFLDDWTVATAVGTRPMYASGVTLRAAAAGGQKAVDHRDRTR